MNARRAALGVLSAATLALGAGGVRAHHSVAAGFDMHTTVTLTGTIRAREFINPHARLFFDVESEDGGPQSWTVWFSSANNLFRRGWRVDDLPVGATITVSGFPARDGSLELYGGDTRLSDGRTLFGGNRPGER